MVGGYSGYGRRRSRRPRRLVVILLLLQLLVCVCNKSGFSEN